MADVLQLGDDADRRNTDPLGLWRLMPASSAEAVGLTSAVLRPETVWRVSLPADSAAAQTLLTRAELSLTKSQLALTAIQDPLQAVVAGHAGTPFTGLQQATTASQLELERLLGESPDDLDADRTVNFTFTPGRLSGLWEQVVTDATAFLARLDTATAHHSRVETERGGRLLAITDLGWRDIRTVWRAGSETEDWALHDRAVGLVFASRLALVRTFLTAIRAATVLVALFTPGGGLLAFPAALRFVAQFLAEARSTPSVA